MQSHVSLVVIRWASGVVVGRWCIVAHRVCTRHSLGVGVRADRCIVRCHNGSCLVESICLSSDRLRLGIERILRAVQARGQQIRVSYVQGDSFMVAERVILFPCFLHWPSFGRRAHDVHTKIKRLVFIIGVLISKFPHIPPVQVDQDDDGNHDGYAGS